MSYKDIIVFIDDGKANRERVNSAIYLSKLFGANLTTVALGSMKPIHAPDLDDQATARMAGRLAESLVADVEEVAKKAGINVNPIIIYGDSDASSQRMAQYARNNDLVMLAQPNPTKNNYQRLKDFADDVLLLSGRPVLFMPYVGVRRKECRGMKRVMIACDGMPSASRALHDSMPLLKDAKEVILLVVESKKMKKSETDLLLEGIVNHLKSHNVNAKPLKVNPGSFTVSTVILNTVTDKGVDLLVMGGYGTPKLQQKIFGGVSSTVLSSMPIPVLMSH